MTQGYINLPCVGVKIASRQRRRKDDGAAGAAHQNGHCKIGADKQHTLSRNVTCYRLRVAVRVEKSTLVNFGFWYKKI